MNIGLIVVEDDKASTCCVKGGKKQLAMLEVVKVTVKSKLRNYVCHIGHVSFHFHGSAQIPKRASEQHVREPRLSLSRREKGEQEIAFT